MDHTINRLIEGAALDSVVARTRKDLAGKAIRLEPRVGATLPCNLIPRAEDIKVEVNAIDLTAIYNLALHAVAGQERDLLSNVAASI